jgi:hypothetical protein
MPIHSEKHAARHPRHRHTVRCSRRYILHTFHCDWHVVPLTEINRICSHLCVRERCEASWVYGRHTPARTPSQQDSTRFSLSHRLLAKGKVEKFQPFDRFQTKSNTRWRPPPPLCGCGCWQHSCFLAWWHLRLCQRQHPQEHRAVLIFIAISMGCVDDEVLV